MGGQLLVCAGAAARCGSYVCVEYMCELGEKLVSETFHNNLCVSYSFFIGCENISTDFSPRSC